MISADNLTCLVAAPPGHDVSALVQALHHRGIAFELPGMDPLPAEARLGAQLASIDLADFTCVVLPAVGVDRESLSLAAGFAIGRGKPVLLLGDSPDARNLATFGMWVQDYVSDAAALGRTLEEFVRHHESAFKEPATDGQLEAVVAAWSAKVDGLATEPAKRAESELDRIVRSAFENIGARVSEPRAYHSDIDLAVWLDEAPPELGEHLLIEVEYGRLSEEQLERAAASLRPHMVSQGSKTGLVVYHDLDGRRFENLSHEMPIVPFFSTKELFAALATGNLAASVRQKRQIVTFR